jgi:hypothetical protein
LTVFSNSEPLFCFHGDSEAELLEKVSRTLESYILNFYNVSDVKIVTLSEPLPARPIAVETFAPLSILRPNLPNLFGRHPEPVAS